MSTPALETLGAMSGGISAMTALIAVIIAVRSERRSRQVMRTHAYLTLRNGFHNVYRRLGDLSDRSDEDVDLRLARQAYWHQCLDEWYVTSRLSPQEMGDLWENFFKQAVVAGYSHPALKETFDEMLRKSPGFTSYAADFFNELENLLPERDEETASSAPTVREKA